MTRQQHLDWAKERALVYLPGDPNQAMTSFMSDLGKHPELAEHAVKELMFMHAMSGLLNVQTCQQLIEGTK